MTPEERFHKNIGLAYYWLGKSKCSIPGYDEDDLLQVALMGLWKACRKYDPSKAKFSTFAIKCIRNEVFCHKKRKSLNTVSLNNPIPDTEGCEYMGVLPSYIEESVLDGVQLAQADLTPEVRAILSLREYLTYAEVAELLGRHKAYVSKLYKNVRKKLAADG